ncbi:autotransporter adhesin family protein [Treponema sp. TIM-1]|uniref:hypothetical protein n=1 Tax=Treponema sp. TIM-1 TaxID=2898417 RepID=UPI00397F194F
MKKFRVLLVLCGMVLWITGCPTSVGENLSINRDWNSLITYITDYNLQTYVPIPSTGEVPVSVVNRGDLDVTVVWRDHTGANLPSLAVFQADTVYRAEIKLIPRAGYGFDPSIPFAYHPGKITSQADDLGDPTRTVTVTYNNSNDADITFITDYNLQSYVPVPIASERPVRAVNTREDMTVAAAWSVQNSPGSDAYSSIDTADSFVFELGAVYRAVIELKTKPKYRFSSTKNFTYTDGSHIEPDGSTTDPDIRKFTVTYLATRAPMKINDYNLTAYLAKPMSGTTAVGFLAAPQYTGTVSWRNTLTQAVLAGPFQYGTAYTAEVTLTPASGYTISGVGGTGGIGQDVFIHTGAETVTNPAGSGVVTIKFPATSNAPSPIVVYDTTLTDRVPRPVSRATPVMSFSTTQYRGTVVWRNTGSNAVLIGQFQTNISYTAVISLTALPGYTFTGIGQNVFTHAHASGIVTNAPNSSTVTINFPPAGPFTHSAMSFGPVGAENSALKLMTELKDNNNPVAIGLPGGEEEVVIPNTVELLADYNSPTNITIDGGGRVLKIQEAGALITVRNGITLTLLNITLKGMDANNRALVRVQSGGRLILGNGAVLDHNTVTAADSAGGGVRVEGGELVINSGAAIKNMTVTSLSGSGVFGGGVLIVTGDFTMNGGIIQDNKVSGGDGSGGGVALHRSGSIIMSGGSIQDNEVEYGRNSAGGVAISNGTGTFYLRNGSIKGNKNNMDSGVGAGGVIVTGDFFMSGADAVIEGNHLSGSVSSGAGGVYSTYGAFTMTDGTIKGNTVAGQGGGGVYAKSFTMSGGIIEGNTVTNGGAGVYLVSNSFIMKGGVIQNNGGTGAYGVYIESTSGAPSTFKMSGTAKIEGNPVFLKGNATITIDGILSSPAPAARVKHEDVSPSSGSTIRLLQASTEDLISGTNLKIWYEDGTSANTHIGIPYDVGGVWYANYKP